MLTLTFFALPAQAGRGPLQEYACIIRVVPETVELGPGGVIGQTLTVAITIEAFSNVSGFDMKFGWNTTYLEYVNHTATIPIEDYPNPIPPSPYGGFLHGMKLLLADNVNTITGTYHAAFATLGGPDFLGNGTAFVMTFRVKNQSKVAVEVPLSILEISFAHLPGGEWWNLIRNGTVIIPEICSDIAVAEIASSKTVIGEGCQALFNITLENQGGYSETFNLTFYANTTLLAAVEGIALEKLTSITLPFPWNTTGLAKGHYNMSCHLTLAPNESDTADNALETIVLVTISGDIDGDKDVDIYDIVSLADAYGTEEGNPRFFANGDLDGDGDIDIYDIVIAADNYGKSW